MTDEEIVKRAKDAEKRTGFGELVHSPISKGVNSAYGIGYIEGMVEYRNSLQEEPIKIKKGCKYRCLSDMINKDTGNIAFIGGKIYLAPKDNTLVSEGNGWRCDTSENASNFELIEEPVIEELEYASEKYACRFSSSKYGHDKIKATFIAGAQWQKENLWKPADGGDLPEIDREVIALLDSGKVVFAHRPPEYWDGKDIVTGKVTRNYPKTYDKGGWNIPDVKYWLDVELPKEIEL